MSRVALALVLLLPLLACSGDDSTADDDSAAVGADGTATTADDVEGGDAAGATSSTVAEGDPEVCAGLADEELAITRELLELLADEDGTIGPDALEGLPADERERIDELQSQSDDVNTRASESGCGAQLDALICERVGELPVDAAIVEQMSAACAMLDDQVAAGERMAAIDTCEGLADEGAVALEELLAGVADLPEDERPESIEGEIPSAVTDGYVLVYSAIDDRATELGCTNDVLQPLLCERIAAITPEGPFGEDLLEQMTVDC
ncbi:MAG: hypothetical protein S0880_12780 [Actinomycetota bacterium]|nr:hypothetical protein [Actinomycetota bacterium]